jgi:hypothetical protein
MNQQSFQLVDGAINVLHNSDENDSTITVLNFEHGEVIGEYSKVVFQW